MFEFPILEWPMAQILSSLIVTSHVASHYERLGKKLSGNFRIPESSKYIVKTLAPTSYNNKEDYQSEAELTGRLKKTLEFSCTTKTVVICKPCNRITNCFYLLKTEIHL